MAAGLSFKSMDDADSTGMNSENNSSSVKLVGGEDPPSIVPASSFRKKEKKEEKKARSSFSFRLKKKTKEKAPITSGQDDNSAEGSDDDPVMEIFEKRSTQRVTFAVEGGDAKPSRRPKERRDKSPPPSSGPISPSSSIKKFMKGALFSSGKGNKGGASDDFDQTLKKEIDLARKDSGLAWEDDDGSKASDIVRQRSKKRSAAKFVEDEVVRANVTKLMNKARRAQKVHFRYEYAVNCYIKALTLLTEANYPDEHPTAKKTVEALNQAHHALNSYKNSANIVKMGIKYEDTGELVRALKMYTIAYRIRRDNLSRSHPSLVVLLNMLGSIQIKRGELEEAMQIYELALKEDTPQQQQEAPVIRPHNLLARGVSYREMGTVHERWGETTEALDMYHRSLDCVTQYKAKLGAEQQMPSRDATVLRASSNGAPLDIHDVQFSKTGNEVPGNSTSADGMEMMIGGDTDKKGRKKKSGVKLTSAYDKYFPHSLEQKNKSEKKKDKKRSKDKTDYADVDVAVTLHQIGQLHRAKGEFDEALAAYNVALRGMKHTLGKNHPNTAAILGNIGNLQKEMGDMDAAFETYQQVLSIESYRLGLSHPDVAVTLHNIATIDAARGNNDHALALYKQVISLQRKLFGENNPSVAVTSACMGDVYERVGDIKQATECFEEAVRIKTAALGRHSLEVARLLHKLGKLAALNGDFHLADSYISRCILVYRLNKLSEEDEWVVDAYRDAADIDAAIAMGRGNTFEC